MSPTETRIAAIGRTAVPMRWTVRFGVFLSFFLALGVGVSAWWIAQLDGLAMVVSRLGAIVTALGLTMTVALTNVSLRWIRWHYLLRSIAVRPTTKDSLLIYLVTLPAILTPFYVGELLRAPLLARKYSLRSLDIVSVWLLERISDFVMLSLFAAVVARAYAYVAVLALIWFLGVLALRFRFRSGQFRNWPRLATLAVVLTLTALTWSLVGIALSGTLALMESPLSVARSLGVFGHTTVLGGVTAIPVGIGVTGSALVRRLVEAGVPQSIAIIATIVFRLGTVWFITSSGAIVLLFKGKRLLRRLRPDADADHFDDIAAEYEHEIPEHVRRRLLKRKVYYMNKALPWADGQPRGLDIGCGHGWYACEMARLGYRMDAVDRSSAQITMARRYAEQHEAACQFTCADAAKLPFDDDTFDFVYAINVLHHVVDADAQLQVFAEIVRVLKPGGVFFLQEVNTLNPLFRFYLGYVFPLIRGIDEGNERWIRPDRLPSITGARWLEDRVYFTFLPDFVPDYLLERLSGLERRLERSRLRTGSAHYIARLEKEI